MSDICCGSLRSQIGGGSGLVGSVALFPYRIDLAANAITTADGSDHIWCSEHVDRDSGTRRGRGREAVHIGMLGGCARGYAPPPPQDVCIEPTRQPVYLHFLMVSDRSVRVSLLSFFTPISYQPYEYRCRWP